MVFMLTKHPSYLPFELMACGCPVLTNSNAGTEWFLKDGENCVLAQPSISSVCEKTEELMENLDLRQHIIQGGLKSVSQTSWTSEIEKIYRFITNSERQ
jgi:glycosyltransferase involved in cell wall biosynthesis